MLESRTPAKGVVQQAPPLDAGRVKIVTPEAGRLAGKVALVTGGGSGIGRAIALAFLREGAKVAVAGRREAKLRETLLEAEKGAENGLAVALDVSRADQAGRAVQETVARFGRLDVLVNCAGILHVSTVEGIPEEQWDELMRVNLKGPFLMSRAALPEFRKAGGGTIVNVGSILGLIAMKDRAAYCASKGGVTMLTKAMAVDHAHEKVRVNCICPSIVETELVRELFAAGPAGEAARRARIAQIPLGRVGSPQDVAAMSVFLASEESSWLTGAAIPLDGGLSAY